MRRRSIVVGVDQSAPSVRAAALAWQIAQLTDSRYHLVHVIDDRSLSTVLGSAFGGRTPTAQLRHEAGRDLRAMLSPELPTAVLARLEVRTGNPGRVLRQVARRERARLVVLGRKQRGLMSRTLLGSTAHQLVRTIDLPLLLVGPSLVPVRRVLAAVDPGETFLPSLPVLVAAKWLAAAFAARLRVVGGSQPGELAAGPLAQEAAAWPADILVVGAPAGRSMSGPLVDPTAARLLGDAPSSSLLVIPAGSRVRELLSHRIEDMPSGYSADELTAGRR